MKVAVTGGAGFIGRRLIKILSARGVAVRALQHRKRVPLLPGIDIVTGSLEDENALATLLDGADVLVHAAGIVAARRPADFDRINAQDTRRIAAAASRRDGLRFLFISSLAARKPETSPYAASKRSAEDIVSNSGLAAWDIIRPPAIYGPGDRRLLPLMRLLAWRLAVVPAGSSGRISLLHVDDLASAVAAWIASGQTMRAIHEIDDGEDHTWHDALTRAAASIGRRPVFIRPPAWILRGIGSLADVAGRWTPEPPFMGSGKVAELLEPDWLARRNPRFSMVTGWKPAVTLHDGLAQTLAWYREQNLLAF